MKKTIFKKKSWKIISALSFTPISTLVFTLILGLMLNGSSVEAKRIRNPQIGTASADQNSAEGITLLWGPIVKQRRIVRQSRGEFVILLTNTGSFPVQERMTYLLTQKNLDTGEEKSTVEGSSEWQNSSTGFEPGRILQRTIKPALMKPGRFKAKVCVRVGLDYTHPISESCSAYGRSYEVIPAVKPMGSVTLQSYQYESGNLTLDLAIRSTTNTAYKFFGMTMEITHLDSGNQTHLYGMQASPDLSKRWEGSVQTHIAETTNFPVGPFPAPFGEGKYRIHVDGNYYYGTTNQPAKGIVGEFEVTAQ